MGEIDVRMKIGLRIKQLRAERDISQEKFAWSIGMARSYFAEIEIGKRNVSAVNLDRIARGMGVSIRDFFNDDLFD